MFESEAKTTFQLTEAEILTLRRESVPNSPKTYFALVPTIETLQERKLEAGALFDGKLPFKYRHLESHFARC
jgi:hypothetical protein